MSTWLEDTNGYVEDFASNAGLHHLRTRGPKSLRDFVSRGGAVSQTALDRIVKDCKGSTDKDVKAAGVVLQKATAPVIISDGTEHLEEFVAEEQRRLIRALPAPSAAVVYSAEQVIAYFDAMDQPTDPTLATWAKVWTPDGDGVRLQIVTFE